MLCAIVSRGIDFHCHFTYGTVDFAALALPILISIVIVISFNFLTWRAILNTISMMVPVDPARQNSTQNVVQLSGDPSQKRKASADTGRTVSTSSDLYGHRHSTARFSFRIDKLYDTFHRLDEYTRYSILRIMLTPVIYFSFFLAIIIVAFTAPSSSATTVILILTLLVSPCNAVLWVFFDTKAMRLWRYRLRYGRWTIFDSEEHLSEVLGGSMQDPSSLSTLSIASLPSSGDKP